MSDIPRDTRFDATIALGRDPYRYVARTSAKLGSDVFLTRLLGREAICMTGRDAAELICDESRFIRAGAAPPALQKTLFGKGGVQGLDDDAHRHRKQMFMSLMTPSSLQQLVESTDEWWRLYADGWTSAKTVDVYPEVRRLLTQAVCEWAAVPLKEGEVAKRTSELTALFDRAGAKGPMHLVSRLARNRAERWTAHLVELTRSGQLEIPDGAALKVISLYRDRQGRLLDTRVAAVDLLNVLRPTVAVAVFIVFIAHALDQYPEWRERLAVDDSIVEPFVQEVRRYYPFFPSILARVRTDFEWRGFSFARGKRVILDLYGTNRDSRAWESPERFDPERFIDLEPDPHRFVAQGPGDHVTGHRCAGEWITIELMKQAARFLTRDVDYELVGGGEINMARLPALPSERLKLTGFRVVR